MATDEKIKGRTRIIINALLNAGREMREVNQLINADRWDEEV
jgi:hypoxanthine-guanine phosphoribosyltransferase